LPFLNMARQLRALVVAAAAAAAAGAQLRVSNVFGNHTVLQRGGAGALLWGWDAPGATVTVSGVGPSPVTATAGADGLWRARLPPQPAGGPFVVTVASSAGGRLALEDVLFGDVWLCGGESQWAGGRRQGGRGARPSAQRRERRPCGHRRRRLGQQRVLVHTTEPALHHHDADTLPPSPPRLCAGQSNMEVRSGVGWRFVREA
jgi:hypothetical protein